MQSNTLALKFVPHRELLLRMAKSRTLHVGH